MDAIAARAEREREHYNQGLKRDIYTRVFVKCDLDRRRRKAIVREQLQYANGRRVLELGSLCWLRWIEELDIAPAELECINISERELAKGIDAAKVSRVKPHFSLMDANALEFPDASFDVVFGNAILHHLDFERALDEVARVLKPHGRILFSEPLGVNPVAKLVRLLTPRARTPDEQPLRRREIAKIRDRFEVTFFHEQFLSVPAAILSALFRLPADNPLTRSAFSVDRFLEANASALRMLYRHVLICGTKGENQASA